MAATGCQHRPAENERPFTRVMTLQVMFCGLEYLSEHLFSRIIIKGGGFRHRYLST